MKAVVLNERGELVSADAKLKARIIAGEVPYHIVNVTAEQYALLRDGKAKMLPIGLVLETETSPGASKIAEAIADALIGALEDVPGFNSQDRENLMAIIDSRLASIRAYYAPDKLALCPVVSCHNSESCAFCMVAAMRDFIILRTPDV